MSSKEEMLYLIFTSFSGKKKNTTQKNDVVIKGLNQCNKICLHQRDRETVGKVQVNYVGFGLICKIVKIIGSTILCFNHSLLFFFPAHSFSHSVAAALVTLVFTNTNWFGVHFTFAFHCSHLSWALPPPSSNQTGFW